MVLFNIAVSATHRVRQVEPSTVKALAPLPPMASARDPWESWLRAGVLVLCTRLSFFAIAYAATALLIPSRQGFIQNWARYDALHFLEIARGGYMDPTGDPNNAAYFPLLPILIHGLSAMRFNAVAAGLLVSALASFVACAFLYRLAEDEIGKGSGVLAVLYLLLFPTAVFLCAPYSEALFLAGAIPAFYYARRGRWALASFGAAVATATRVTGVFLMLGLLFEFLRQKNLSMRHAAPVFAWLAVGALPLIAYMVYLGVVKNDPIHFATVQRAWGHELSDPVTNLLSTWRVFWNGQLLGLPVTVGPRFVWLGELVAAVVGVGLTILFLLKQEWGYAAYMGSLMAVLLVIGPTYVSIPRYLLALFPIPLFLAEVTRDCPFAALTLLATIAPLATLGLLIYTGGTAWYY